MSTLRTTVFAIRLFKNGSSEIRQVAKLMRVTDNWFAPELSGKGILYKVINTGIHTMNKSQTLGVDKDAFDACLAGGAEFVVFWVRDTNSLLVAKCTDYTDLGTVEDYGEGEQYHLSLNSFTAHSCAGCGQSGPLHQGVFIPQNKWHILKDVVKAKKPERKPAAKKTAQREDAQRGLF